MMPDEQLISAESTALLRRGLVEGYLLIVTDRRVVGIKSLKAGFLGSGSAAGAVAGGAVGAAIGAKLQQSAEDRARGRAVEALASEKKDFEFAKTGLACIEFTEPTLFRGGLLRFVPTDY